MLKFYLAGPVGYGSPGVEWKKDIKDNLRDKGHEVYDPIENDHKYPLVPLMNSMKGNPKDNHESIKNIMQPIFHDDCSYIKEADYIVCYFCNRALGTASEQGIAYFLKTFSKKRVKTISIFDPSFTPDEWVICCSDHIFFSIKDCLEYIQKEFSHETICNTSRI